MIYQVEFDKPVLKFLQKCERHIALSFIEKVETLKLNPKDPSLNVKKLSKPLQGYRLRIGKYRFLYDIIEDKILIYFYDADSRGDIYK